MDLRQVNLALSGDRATTEPAGEWVITFAELYYILAELLCGLSAISASLRLCREWDFSGGSLLYQYLLTKAFSFCLKRELIEKGMSHLEPTLILAKTPKIG